jgi:hypothetical protein
LNTVGADRPPCILEQLGNAAVAVTAILRSERKNGLRQCILVGPHDHTITLCAEWLADQPAGVAFREMILLANMLNGLQTPFGDYKFPDAMSFRTCFSSDRSATRRFRRLFSFSRSFIFLV